MLKHSHIGRHWSVARLSLFSLVILLLISLLTVWSPSAYSAGRTPVIIIPGVAGSTFKTGPSYNFYEADNGHGGSYQHSYGANETVWVNAWEAALPGADDYFDIMRMQPDGDTPYVPYANFFVDTLYNDAYSDLIDYLHRQGYIDNITLFTFAYDWRRDIPNATYTKLDNLVNQARARAGTSQVDLLGHSMGGLVARNYSVSDPAAAAKVRRLISFGSPYLGSPKFLKALLYGDQFGPSFLGLGLDPNEIKDLVQNMAGGWELLPSRAYYDFYNNTTGGLLSPYREDRDVDGDGRVGGVLGYSGISTFLRNLGKNQNTASLAQSFHDRLDNSWPTGGPRVSVINGSGLATLGQIRDYTGSCWSWFRYVPCPKTDILNVDGDGTVPFFSATPSDGSRNLNLLGEASVHLVNREHGALVQYDKTLGIYTGDGPSLTLLGQILNNSVDRLANTQSLAWPGLEQTQNPIPRANGKRLGLNGYSISVTNGVQLEVYDGRGNHTGRQGNPSQRYEQNVPGSSLETIEGTQVLYLPATGQYTVRLSVPLGGSFDLKLRLLEGDTIKQTFMYLNVVAQAGDQAEVSLAGPAVRQKLPAVQLAGKPITPTALLDALASTDQTAPLINLTAPTPTGDGQLRFNWQTEDSGAGLLLQQALLDPDTADSQPVQAGQALRLSAGAHRLQVLAQDRAGNTSQRELTFKVP